MNRSELPLAQSVVSGIEQGKARTVPVVDVSALSKSFVTRDGIKRRALDEISLRVENGEFVVVIGPSGCGKTTLLRCVAGLEHADTGRIQISGRTVYSPSEGLSLPPEARNLSMVFQSYALWPHKSLVDNVAYPLQCRGTKKAAAREAAARVLSQLGLEDRINAYPAQLSGGQQQRVALARAMVAGSKLVLFDEPLSNLDAQVRERIRSELGNLQREHGFAALYVTHDQSEAMGLADTLVVMRRGRIEQIGAPHDVYMRPKSSYVANFLGRANLLHGTVSDIGDGNVSVDTSAGVLVGRSTVDGAMARGARAVALIRPEHVEIARGVIPSGPNCIEALVMSSRFLGGVTESELRVGSNLILAREANDEPLVVGERVRMRFRVERLNVVPDEGQS